MITILISLLYGHRLELVFRWEVETLPFWLGIALVSSSSGGDRGECCTEDVNKE